MTAPKPEVRTIAEVLRELPEGRNFQSMGKAEQNDFVHMHKAELQEFKVETAEDLKNLLNQSQKERFKHFLKSYLLTPAVVGTAVVAKTLWWPVKNILWPPLKLALKNPLKTALLVTILLAAGLPWLLKFFTETEEQNTRVRMDWFRRANDAGAPLNTNFGGNPQAGAKLMGGRSAPLPD